MNKQSLIDNLKQEYQSYLFTDGVVEQPSISELGVIDLYFEFPNGWIIGHKFQTATIDNELVVLMTNFYRNVGIDLTWWFTGDELNAHFDADDFSDSYVCKSRIIPKLTFLTLCTWGKLPLHRVINGTNQRIGDHLNVNSSLTSHIDKCVKSGIFIKKGAGPTSIISLSENFADTDKFKQESWHIPSKNAVRSVKERRGVK